MKYFTAAMSSFVYLSFEIYLMISYGVLFYFLNTLRLEYVHFLLSPCLSPSKLSIPPTWFL